MKEKKTEYSIVDTRLVGRARSKHFKTASIQVLRKSGMGHMLEKEFRYTVGNEEYYRKAEEKAKAYIASKNTE